MERTLDEHTMSYMGILKSMEAGDITYLNLKAYKYQNMRNMIEHYHLKEGSYKFDRFDPIFITSKKKREGYLAIVKRR